MSSITSESPTKPETILGEDTLNAMSRGWSIVWPSLLLMALVFALSNTPKWGLQEAVLTITVAIQILFALPWILERKLHWSVATWWPLIFYGGGLLLWIVQLQLSGYFDWVFWLFVGGLIMSYPIRVSIPLAVLCLLIEAVNDSSTPTFFPAFSTPQQMGALLTDVIQDILFFDGWPIFLFLSIRYLNQVNHERGQLINNLQIAQTELAVARQQEIELATLRERERLARDLHDGLGHTLTATAIQLEAIQRLYPIDPKRASAQIDELKAITRQSMTSLRRSLEGLRTSGLGDRLLHEALTQLIDELRQRNNFEITYQISPTVNSLTPYQSEVIWRICQEALTNIEKHAQASHVQLELTLTDTEVKLYIADDGVGLPANADRQPGHYGLRGIRERVEALDGTLELQSNSLNGATIIARVPMNG